MSFAEFPTLPSVPEAQIGRGKSALRFEDVAQDGRVRIEGVWPPIGPILWGKMDVARSLMRLGQQGIRAILTYVLIEGGSDPVSVRNACEHSVRWQLGHCRDARGEVSRLLFDTWLTSTAPRGVLDNPAVPSDGETVLVARAYGQHVLTKPAAAPGQHRVLRLDGTDFPAQPETELRWRDPRGILALPPGSVALEPTPRADSTPIVFGLCHTDGNQHVNFLSYPRLAEEAAIRRLHGLGLGARHLARRAEIGYRKPCFVGDRVCIVLQAFRLADEIGVAGAFFAAEEVPAEVGSFSELPAPRAVVRLGFPA